jgi:hypothetical protein
MKTQTHFFALLSLAIWSNTSSLTYAEEPVTRTTSTGAVFTQIMDRPHFEGAWQDPSGIIWGNTVTYFDGLVRGMTQPEAIQYCQSIGGQLPSRKDFEQLGRFMGATGTGSTYDNTHYSPQILPGLADRKFWTSSHHPEDDDLGYYFEGKFGYFFSTTSSDPIFQFAALRAEARLKVRFQGTSTSSLKPVCGYLNSKYIRLSDPLRLQHFEQK